jgi:ketohexokinase
MSNRTRLIAVGACAIDTILTVPYFPKEDAKLRATSLVKRRGGNTPNTLEVLQQLIGEDVANGISRGSLEGPQERSSDTSGVELYLIATLPSRQSSQTAYMASSFHHASPTKSIATQGTVSQTSTLTAQVDLSHCVYREDHTEPISSYIISSQSDSSRTIINHNALPEMTFEEFGLRADELLWPYKESAESANRIWFHFEGRIPQTALQCIQYLRNHAAFGTNNGFGRHSLQLKISVELEKPGREGLQDLAHEADVVFYSRSWAEGEGHQNAEGCLKAQSDILQRNSAIAGNERLLVCTWGAKGAFGLLLPAASSPANGHSTIASQITHSAAHKSGERAIVDTTGNLGKNP